MVDTLFSDSNRQWEGSNGRKRWALKFRCRKPRARSFAACLFAAQNFANGYKTRCRTRNRPRSREVARFCKRPSFADVLEFTCNLWVWQSQNGSRLFSHCITCSTVQPTNIHHPHVESTEPYPIAVVQLAGRPLEALENM